MNKLYKTISAIALMAMCLLAALPAQADEEVQELFNKVNAINPGLIDYQAAITLDVHAKWAFIPYSPKLSGHYYHKAPDKHKLVLEDAPSFIKNQPNAFGFSLPSLKRYNGKVTGTSELNGRKVYEVTLFPNHESSVISLQLWIDCEEYTVPRQVTNYKDNGRLTVDAHYTTIGKYKVFDRMQGTFNFPKVKVNATANATYSDYKFDQGLPDSFFPKKK